MKYKFKVIGGMICLATLSSTNLLGIEATQIESDNHVAFQVQEAKEAKEIIEEISYEEANRLSFELLNMDDTTSEDYVIGTFKITNNSDQPIDYFSIDFAFLDSEGNQIDNDGRFNDFQIASSKSALAKTFYKKNGNDKKINDIIVTNYKYHISETDYRVDLQREIVDTYPITKKADKDFEEANILEFSFNELGYNSNYYQVETQIKNLSDRDLIYVTFDMAYLDENGDLLDKDGRFNDEFISPEKFVTVTSSTDGAEAIGSYGIYAYEYSFSEPDELGFNTYEVNLQTMEVEGKNKDR